MVGTLLHRVWVKSTGLGELTWPGRECLCSNPAPRTHHGLVFGPPCLDFSLYLDFLIYKTMISSPVECGWVKRSHTLDKSSLAEDPAQPPGWHLLEGQKGLSHATW